jgi:hypothetical protein
VSLSNLQVEKTREQIKRYVSQFDISVVEATRQKASGMLDQFYIRSLPKVT